MFLCCSEIPVTPLSSLTSFQGTWARRRTTPACPTLRRKRILLYSLLLAASTTLWLTSASHCSFHLNFWALNTMTPTFPPSWFHDVIVMWIVFFSQKPQEKKISVFIMSLKASLANAALMSSFLYFALRWCMRASFHAGLSPQNISLPAFCLD